MRNTSARGVCIVGLLVLVAAVFGPSEISIHAKAEAGTTTQSADQRTLVILANFSDKALTCTADSVRSLMFDPTLSLAALYKDNSRGTVNFSGDVVGPYTLNIASTDPCGLSAVSVGAEAMATASGVDVSAYPRRVYVLPPSTCPGGGNGTMSGVPTYAWIHSCAVRGNYVHNLGHNLGMDHAGTSGNFPQTEYGDSSDPLGWANNVFSGFNAPHRHQMGWLDPTRLEVVSEDGSFNVVPLALDSPNASGPKMLSIAKSDTNELYSVSYRQPVGFDSYVDGMAFDRLSIHRYRIDGSSTKTTLVARLEDGESFVDPVNGITIRLISHSATAASTEVSFAGVPCQRTSPTLAVLPQTTSGQPGTSVNYTMSLTNADSQACSSTTFALSASVPAGWSSTVLPSTITVSPGGSGQATVSVRSSSSAQGTYTSTVAGNSADGRSVSAGVTHVVVVGDSEPPTPPTSLVATANKQQKQIQLSWDRSSDNTGVIGYRVWRDGSPMGTTSNTTWVDEAWKSGASYSYIVAAYDAAGNVSPPSTGVMVNLPGAGGRGSK